MLDLIKKNHPKNQKKQNWTDPNQLAYLEKWHKNGGDKKFLFDPSLSNSSIVFELGGYLGDWAAEISARSAATIYVFEPLLEFSSQAKTRFLNNPKIHVIEAAAWIADSYLPIAEASDSTSLVRSNSSSQKTIKAIDLVKFITKKKLKSIDLMQINIEGGEYDLLNHLIDSGVVKIINKLQIQFHHDIDDAEQKREKLIADLQKTHKKTFSYPFVWEGWKLK